MARQLILGLGAGQCGLELLAEILEQQPSTRVVLQQPPLLPWGGTVGASGFHDRLRRLLTTTRERFLGDVASFHLPYVEQAVSFDPTIRMVCLKRPVDEIVTGFVAALNRNPRTPIDHWSERPMPPFEPHLLWSRTFPKYDVADRETGIRRYWADYYGIAETLAQRFPDQFRVIDTERLTTEDGVRDILAFCGFPWSDHVVITGRRPSGTLPSAPPLPPHPYPDPLDPRRCVILVPFSGFIHQDCDLALRELERRGYSVRRVGGYSQIDRARSQMVTDAILEGFEETLWIDSDIVFQPDDVETLRRLNLPIVCGIYPQKGKQSLACHVMPGTPSTVFGQDGQLIEILYAGTGFLLVRREVYLTIQRQFGLPTTNERFGRPLVPFFHPLTRPHDEGAWYLGEDYSFCHRARDCGYKIHADTTIRLWHIGTYRYGWEDAGRDRPRSDPFRLHFDDGGPLGPPVPIDEADPNVRSFIARYPWPGEKPQVPPPPSYPQRAPSTQEVLQQTISSSARVIVELGPFLGHSTRFLADHAQGAIIIAIDPWHPPAATASDPEEAALLSRLQETFLSECWLYRDQVVPVRQPSAQGLRLVADAGVRPDAIVFTLDVEAGIDSSSTALHAALCHALDLFPQARIVGDHWDWDSIRRSVQDVCHERGLQAESHGAGWRILPTNIRDAPR